MDDKRTILQVLFGAIEDINQQLPKEKQLDKSADTALFGESSVLDSLGFVLLIVAVEQRIREKFGVTVNLADGEAPSRENTPFETIGTLTDYISSFLEKNKG